eukprot:g7283.t1
MWLEWNSSSGASGRIEYTPGSSGQGGAVPDENGTGGMCRRVVFAPGNADCKFFPNTTNAHRGQEAGVPYKDKFVLFLATKSGRPCWNMDGLAGAPAKAGSAGVMWMYTDLQPENDGMTSHQSPPNGARQRFIYSASDTEVPFESMDWSHQNRGWSSAPYKPSLEFEKIEHPVGSDHFPFSCPRWHARKFPELAWEMDPEIYDYHGGSTAALRRKWVNASRSGGKPHASPRWPNPLQLYENELLHKLMSKNSPILLRCHVECQIIEFIMATQAADNQLAMIQN